MNYINMANTYYILITTGLKTFVIANTPVFSLYVVVLGPPINP